MFVSLKGECREQGKFRRSTSCYVTLVCDSRRLHIYVANTYYV
jgi:hypothetical protein